MLPLKILLRQLLKKKITEQETDPDENGDTADTESPVDTETEPSTASISDFVPQPAKPSQPVLATTAISEGSSKSADSENQNPIVIKPLNFTFLNLKQSLIHLK